VIKQIAKLVFYTIVGTVCAIMIGYALVDIFVNLSTIIWVHNK